MFLMKKQQLSAYFLVAFFLYLLVGSEGGRGVTIYLYFLNRHEKLLKQSVGIFFVHVGVKEVQIVLFEFR